MSDITPEDLHKLLICDAEAGKLWWRERTPDMFNVTASRTAEHTCARWNSQWAGKRAFTTLSNYGYFQGAIYDKKYLAHRVIWAMETGAWPVEQIDHIDHDRTHNRFKNLREVTHQENHKNMPIQKSNTSGFTGVVWDKDVKKWRAQTTVDGKSKYLGLSNCITAAAIARKQADIKYGFHELHGVAK